MDGWETGGRECYNFLASASTRSVDMKHSHSQLKHTTPGQKRNAAMMGTSAKKKCMLNTTAHHSCAHTHMYGHTLLLQYVTQESLTATPTLQPSLVQHHGQQPYSSDFPNKHGMHSRFPLGDTKARLPR